MKALIATVLLLLATTTSAQEIKLLPYADVANWHIVQAEHPKVFGCSLTTTDANQSTELVLTLSMHESVFAMLMHSPAWVNLEMGEFYTVVSQIDDLEPWEHQLIGVGNGGVMVRSLLTHPSIGAWLREVEKGSTLTFFYQENPIATFALEGSKKAIEVWAECALKEKEQFEKASRGPFMSVQTGDNS